MIIDATNKSLGRLATEIATVLQGKHKADYVPREAGDEAVEVKNLDAVKITGAKLANKKYFHYSGYPGGMKATTLGELWAKDKRKVLLLVIDGMLPKNKLHDQRLKRVKVL